MLCSCLQSTGHIPHDKSVRQASASNLVGYGIWRAGLNVLLKAKSGDVRHAMTPLTSHWTEAAV